MEITIPAPSAILCQPAPRPKTKRHGSANVIKAFLYMLRRKPGKPKSLNSIPLDMAANGTWKRLVGSMRPMHVQDTGSPPPSIGAVEQPGMSPAGWSETTSEDIFTPPLSPWEEIMATPATSSGYESPAVNVQELGLYEDEEIEAAAEESACGEDDGGDEMIDAKADEFIANFYEQMRLQNSQ